MTGGMSRPPWKARYARQPLFGAVKRSVCPLFTAYAP